MAEEKEIKTENTQTSAPESQTQTAPINKIAPKIVQKTGFSRGFSQKSFRSSRFGDRQPSEFDSKLLDLARVTRVAAGGKHMRFRAVIIAGNRAGKIGLGAAKGLDVSQAVDKATRLAKKNMITFPIVNETIPYDIKEKFGAAVILLKPQKKGKGLIAGGVVRQICELAGIANISSKVLGTTGNKLNNARAVIKALSKLKQPKAE